MFSYLAIAFIFIFLLSFLFIIIGLISPRVSLFWHKTKKSRKFSTLLYGLTTIFSFILIFVFWGMAEAMDEGEYSSGPIDPNIDKVDKLTEKGREYSDKEQLDSALIMYSKVIDMKPDTSKYQIKRNLETCYKSRAYIYKQRNKYDLALADYNHLISLDKGSVPVYESRAELYQSQGKNELALKDLDTVIKINKGAGAYVSRGDLYLSIKNYPKATEDYEQALKLDKNNIKYLSKLASISESAENYPRAISYYNTILNLDPGNAHMLGHKALVRGILKDFENAMTDVNKALKMDDKMGELYDIRGRIKSDAGLKGVCEDLRKAEKLGEDETKILKSCGCS